MTMTPRLSKFVLTSHVTFSVGWLGAVAVFLAFAITGITSKDTNLARAAYFAMEVSAWFVIVPFCLASLLTGLIQSLGSKWGLFKHYWIIVKLVLTVVATVLLLLHMKPISYLAGVATDSSFSNTQELASRIQIITQAGGAILLLLATTTLSIYKPWGKTQFGLSKSSTPIRGRKASTKRSLGYYILIGLGCLAVIFIIIHILGGGMGHH